MSYTNGEYTRQQTRKFQPQSGERRFPDEEWQVGDSEITASVWIARGRNSGDEYLDLRRIKDDGTQLKTFRKSDIRSYFLGLAEHCARIADQEDLSDNERDAFAALAEGTVELLEATPMVEKSKRKLNRKKRNRRS